MANFYQIFNNESSKFRVFMNMNDTELLKKFAELNRNERLTLSFQIVIEAVRENVDTRSQFNFELDTNRGKVYAIKVIHHRFYTLLMNREGFRELYIYRYGKKESNSNNKKLRQKIESIHTIEINRRLL